MSAKKKNEEKKVRGMILITGQRSDIDLRKLTDQFGKGHVRFKKSVKKKKKKTKPVKSQPEDPPKKDPPKKDPPKKDPPKKDPPKKDPEKKEQKKSKGGFYEPYY